MRKLYLFALIVSLVVSLFAPAALAATAIERIESMEAVLGIAAYGDTIDGRLTYLEEQLGIQREDGQTLDERMSVLEEMLGLSGTGTGSGPEVGPTKVRISDLEVFTKDNMEIAPIDIRDNYNGTHPDTLRYSGYREYFLDGEYKTLNGVFFVTKTAREENVKDSTLQTGTLRIYGDDKQLYELKGLTMKDKPVTVEVDVTGVSFLKIVQEQTGGYLLTTLSFGDVYLTK